MSTRSSLSGMFTIMIGTQGIAAQWLYWAAAAYLIYRLMAYRRNRFRHTVYRDAFFGIGGCHSAASRYGRMGGRGRVLGPSFVRFLLSGS